MPEQEVAAALAVAGIGNRRAANTYRRYRVIGRTFPVCGRQIVQFRLCGGQTHVARDACRGFGVDQHVGRRNAVALVLARLLRR